MKVCAALKATYVSYGTGLGSMARKPMSASDVAEQCGLLRTLYGGTASSVSPGYLYLGDSTTSGNLTEETNDGTNSASVFLTSGPAGKL